MVSLASSAAVATAVVTAVAAYTVKKDNDEDYPDDPFAATVIVITKEHSKNSFLFYIKQGNAQRIRLPSSFPTLA